MSARPLRDTSQVDALMRERIGLNVQHLEEHERKRRILTAMDRAGFRDDASFANFLRASPGGLLDLASEMSVAETYFFRDPDQLKLLTDEILPLLLVHRPRDHRLKIWSAGCASGEEAYTIAMLLDERGLLRRAQIVGSDISEHSLARARAGRYSNWSLRATPQLAQQRYFRRTGGSFELSAALKAHVSFERQSLTEQDASAPGGVRDGFDLILCKNVLIYFTEQACALASERLARSLALGGTLLTGASDRFCDLPGLWQRSTTRAGVTFARVSGPVCARAAEGALRLAARGPEGAGALYARAPEGAGALYARAPEGAGALYARAPEGALRRPLPRSMGVQTIPLASPLRPPVAVREPGRAVAAAQPRQRAVVRAQNSEQAVEACRASLRDEPTSVPLHVHLASLLIELGRDAEAEAVLRTLLYLDGQLALAHFLSGLVWRRLGELRKAARAYRRVITLCEGRPEDEPVPCAEEVSHRGLAAAASEQARLLERAVQP